MNSIQIRIEILEFETNNQFHCLDIWWVVSYTCIQVAKKLGSNPLIPSSSLDASLISSFTPAKINFTYSTVILPG